MHWAQGFIAVDWGTTNRRAYRMGADGTLIAEMEDDRGILSVGTGDFQTAVGEVVSQLGDLPLLLGGMIGSNRGWVDTPYVRCPVSISDLAARLQWVEPGRIAIVPGVSVDDGEKADVMRGEEVQIFGALANCLVPADASVCHPGTHNKWVRLEGGQITGFTTVMTGEIFSLLKEHSILAEILEGDVVAGDAFAAGVRRGFASGDLTAQLFSVRARVILGKARREDAADFTSGLLIGADLRTGLQDSGTGEIFVMGRPELTALFQSALHQVGRASREIDGETAFLAGARHLAETIG